MKFIRKEDLMMLLEVINPNSDWVTEEELQVALQKWGSDVFYDRTYGGFGEPVRNAELDHVIQYHGCSVTFCRNCGYYDARRGCCIGRPGEYSKRRLPNDFCSRGVRKEKLDERSK